MTRSVAPLGRIPTWWCLAALSLLGMVLRAIQPGIVAFNLDEAVLSIYASQVANAMAFPLVGVRSGMGFSNPPLLVYLAAPFFAITPDPRFATVMLAMVGSAAVGLTGLTARRLWGGWTAVVAGALVAFSPMAIEHSRRLWGHDTIVFWSALVLYATVRGIQSRSRRWLILALAAAAGAMSCHLSGALLFVAPVLALVLFRPPWRRHVLLVGAGILALLYVPWVIEDSRLLEPNPTERFRDVRLIGRAVTGQDTSGPPGIPVPTALAWLRLPIDAAHVDVLGPAMPLWRAHDPGAAAMALGLAALMSLLVVAGVGLTAGTATSRRADADSRRWAAVLSAQALAPLVVFGLLPVAVVPLYQLPALTAQLLLAAWVATRLPSAVRGVGWAKQRRSRVRVIGVAGGAAAALAMVVGGVWITLSQRHFVDTATPDRPVETILTFKLNALTQIVGEGTLRPGRPYALMQDARSPEAGIDLWVLYLHFRLTGQAAAPTSVAAPVVYVLRDHRTVIRPELQPLLDSMPSMEFGTLRVYHLEDEDANLWRDLTTFFPSSPRRNGAPAAP